MHNLFFCDEPCCVQIFEDQEEYELHCLRGIHGDQELQQNALEQDKIRNNYASLMKISLQISFIMNVSQGQNMDQSMDMVCAEYPVIEYMKKEGWVLPVRNNF